MLALPDLSGRGRREPRAAVGDVQLGELPLAHLAADIPRVAADDDGDGGMDDPFLEPPRPPARAPSLLASQPRVPRPGVSFHEAPQRSVAAAALPDITDFTYEWLSNVLQSDPLSRPVPSLSERLRNFVLPSWDIKRHSAAIREVESLSLAIDMLRRGASSMALDHLCRRVAGVWMGVETGNWTLAGTLAGQTRSAVACLPSDVQVSLARTMRMQQHLTGGGRGAGRGGGGDRVAGGAAADGDGPASQPAERRGRKPYYGAQSGASAPSQGARPASAGGAVAGSQQS